MPEAGLVEGHVAAAQVALQLFEVALEWADRVRREAEVGEGGVAAPDAEVRAPAALRLDAGDRAGGDGGMPRVGVGHAGAELDAAGRVRGQAHRHVAVAGQVLAVDVDDPVEAEFLGPHGLLHPVEHPVRHVRRRPRPHRPEFSHRSALLCSRAGRC